VKKSINGFTANLRTFITVSLFCIVLAGFIWSAGGWYVTGQVLAGEVASNTTEIGVLKDTLHSIDTRLAVLEEGVTWIKDKMQGQE